jgi:hypothetical protein
VALSVTLLVGGVWLARTTRLTAVELTYGSEAEVVNAVLSLVTVLTFSVVGAIVASRHPRNTIGWLFCSMKLVGINTRRIHNHERNYAAVSPRVLEPEPLASQYSA